MPTCGSCGEHVKTIGRSDRDLLEDLVLCQRCGTWVDRRDGTARMGAS